MIPFSILFLLLIVVIVMIRAFDLNPWQAFACAALGFYVAQSNFSDTFQGILNQIFGIFSSIHL
ncbi:hypothetical protein CcI6DRAFT_04756 [Frankia sp. CcI6]|uniref:hypothetical protein n=1 Tax=Frankia TaxID=1854 RepID=UPI0003D025F0|nr:MULTISPECIES: hypothetical protein [Frankia]ESZ99834.1 hypothetical protein CcI6DRAFT_04756 [Frankia sp. CcI6]KDA40423.1 hypothetical protein BMG523Draft_04771 [Frankia sp. BMG5.23]KFB04631.1 hypothetical protein ALLO2DRAFT_02560 [Frankia sp. Allo2]OAA20803.1 hypothetical protein AAY23_10859 [Frankia casuarinae]OFB38481.1 hypothetical protein Manayef4_21540 [Frankia sp. CgIM4]